MQLWTCWSSYELRDKRETSSRLRLCGLGTALATVSCMLDMILHDFTCVLDLFCMLLVGSRASMQLFVGSSQDQCLWESGGMAVGMACLHRLAQDPP